VTNWLIVHESSVFNIPEDIKEAYRIVPEDKAVTDCTIVNECFGKFCPTIITTNSLIKAIRYKLAAECRFRVMIVLDNYSSMSVDEYSQHIDVLTLSNNEMALEILRRCI
jgi:hypothetical protein